ncbi:MAG: hypothetical protein DMF81_26905 [Acidobacteria bacterium]|nr:MAG: hypothetical protein DMF81_26905 [Acidobacteriota bacterium]
MGVQFERPFALSDRLIVLVRLPFRPLPGGQVSTTRRAGGRVQGSDEAVATARQGLDEAGVFGWSRQSAARSSLIALSRPWSKSTPYLDVMVGS